MNAQGQRVDVLRVMANDASEAWPCRKRYLGASQADADQMESWKARSIVAALIGASKAMLESATQGANSGDWGAWNADDWKELVDLREALARVGGAQS